MFFWHQTLAYTSNSHDLIDIHAQLSAANARISELESTIQRVEATVASNGANNLLSPRQAREKPPLSRSLSQILQNQRTHSMSNDDVMNIIDTPHDFLEPHPAGSAGRSIEREETNG